LRQAAASCGELRPESESKSESNPNPNPEAETRTREAAAAAATLEVYASGNLTVLSPRNMEELVGFKADLPEDLIRHAIDEACANGKRTWAYTRSILSRYLQKGIRSVGEAKAEKETFRQQRQQSAPTSNPALNYEQHAETNYKNLFIDLDNYEV
jgi:DnaD/phage-associated family protein